MDFRDIRSATGDVKYSMDGVYEGMRYLERLDDRDGPIYSYTIHTITRAMFLYMREIHVTLRRINLITEIMENTFTITPKLIESTEDDAAEMAGCWGMPEKDSEFPKDVEVRAEANCIDKFRQSLEREEKKNQKGVDV